MHRMHVHPPSPPLCIPPLAMCIPPPPQPERLVMRKDDAVGNKKKIQVFLHATYNFLLRIIIYKKQSFNF